jgi:hypothetical protein
MATKSNTKRYIPTTYMGAYGGAGGSAKMANSTISNGVVAGTGGKNLTSQDYPSAAGTSSGSSSSGYVLRARGNGGSSGSGSSGASTRGFESSKSYMENHNDDGYSALLAAYQQKQNDYEEYLRQQREAAQRAYDRGMSSLNNAYNSQINSLSSNLNSTRGQLADSYNRSKSNVNRDAESSLRQAYINNMLSQKVDGKSIGNIGNTSLKWETTSRLTAGLEGNFLGNRLNIHFNYFKGWTQNLLTLHQLA